MAGRHARLAVIVALPTERFKTDGLGVWRAAQAMSSPVRL
jgi:hypothetical protein